MAIVQIEKRKRGPLGWLVAILFWGFNIVMAVSLFFGLEGAGEAYSDAASDAEKAGTAIGTVIGTGMVLTFWVMGVTILGFMMLFTRGKKVITTKEA